MVRADEARFTDWHIKYLRFQEDADEGGWQGFMLESWAVSTRECYERHIRAMRGAHEESPDQTPTEILREYLISMYRQHKTSSSMRQAISACRLLEELEVALAFVPRSFWRFIRAKDKVSKARRQRWASLGTLEVMARQATTEEEMLCVCIATLSLAFCLRVGEAASIRPKDLDQQNGYVNFYDSKTRRAWVSRPASEYVWRVMGLARLLAMRRGRDVSGPLIKGGAARLQHIMASLLVGTEHADMRWHAWRRAGATLLVRSGATILEVMSWARWRSVKVARRYVATWEDLPWEDARLPQPTHVSGTAVWFFKVEDTRATNLWPKSIGALDHGDGWSSGSEAEKTRTALREEITAKPVQRPEQPKRDRAGAESTARKPVKKRRVVVAKTVAASELAARARKCAVRAGAGVVAR